jgi:hypothetical protein
MSPPDRPLGVVKMSNPAAVVDESHLIAALVP